MDPKTWCFYCVILMESLAEIRTVSFCEYSTLNITCEFSHIIVTNATYGRVGPTCGQSSRVVCPLIDVTAAVAKKCDDSLTCKFTVDDEFFGIVIDDCRVKKYLNVTYDCYGNVNQIGTWDVASTNCSLSSGYLPSIHDLNTTDNTGTKGFWLRERWHYTDFYWIEGCFDILGNDNITKTELSSNNGIYQCLEYCNGSQHIGLMDKTCICINDEHSTVINEDGNCSLTCTGNKMDICGNVNTMTRYSKYKGNLDIKGEQDNNKNCFYIQKIDFELHWLYEDCESNNVDGYICMKYSEPSIRTAYINQLSWTEARRECISKAEDLARIISYNYDIIDIVQNKKYWIGLYRNRQIINNDTTNSDDVVCGTWRPDLASSVYYVACNENRSFHCNTDNKIASTGSSIMTTGQSTSINDTLPVDNTNAIKAGLIGGALGLSVVLVLACFGVCLGCFRFHNRKRPIKRRKLTQSTSNKMSEGDDDVFIVSENDKDIKHKSYPPPVKPVRRKSSSARVSYENVPMDGNKDNQLMRDEAKPDDMSKTNVLVNVDILADNDVVKLKTSASNISLPGDMLGSNVYDYASQVENKSTKNIPSYELVDNEAEYETTVDGEYDVMNRKRPKHPEASNENIYDRTADDMYDTTIKQGSAVFDLQYDTTAAFKSKGT